MHKDQGIEESRAEGGVPRTVRFFARITQSSVLSPA